MSDVETTKQISPEVDKSAARRAADKSRVAMWDLNIPIRCFDSSHNSSYLFRDGNRGWL